MKRVDYFCDICDKQLSRIDLKHHRSFNGKEIAIYDPRDKRDKYVGVISTSAHTLMLCEKCRIRLTESIKDHTLAAEYIGCASIAAKLSVRLKFLFTGRLEREDNRL